MSISRTKIYYISFCLFFLLGGFVTAFVNGQQADNDTDMSWNRPEKFVAYMNSYLNEKVNPSTLADILITQYVEHPLEATNTMPLYPTQSIMQDRFLVNCSITEIETYIVPDEKTGIGTDVVIGFFVKWPNSNKWELKSYQTVSTEDVESSSMKITIETPRINFNEEGGQIRVVFTNFGNEYSDVVYIPTFIENSENGDFKGLNTVVNGDESIFLTIKNRFRKLYGSKFYVTYDRFEGIEYHEQSLNSDDCGEISMDKDEIIALFDYPSLVRRDLYQYQYDENRAKVCFSSPTRRVRSKKALLGGLC